MQVLLSAIGIVISALIGLPAATVSLNKINQNKIARSLINLSDLLENVIKKGEIILKNIDSIVKNSRKENIIEYKEELLEVIKLQIKDLKRISEIIQNDFLWGNNIELDSKSKVLYKKNRIPHILKIYAPHIKPSLDLIVEFKTEVLTLLMDLLYQQIDGFEVNKFYIREIEYIDEEIISSQLYRFQLPMYMDQYTEKGYIKFKVINLASKTQREKYINLASKKLSCLSSMRNQLVEVIKKYYTPQDIS